MSPGDTCSSDSSNNFVVNFLEARCSNYKDIQINVPTINPIAFNSLGVPVNSSGTPIGDQTVGISLVSSSQNITIEQGTGRVH